MGKGQKRQITKEKLEQWIRDYHWMINTVEELQSKLEYQGARISRYGVEAALPKAVGSTIDVVFNEAYRRMKHLKRINEYIYRIQEVQKRVDKVTEPREAEVLYWLLEGKSLRWIGSKLNLSHTSIRRIKERIIKKML